MEPFNLLHTPLSGRHLIEASAGTGKTFTIAGLYLRLLLERRLRADQILVVTFTEAATEELRDRIRRRLREAVDAFAAGSSDDPLLDGLLGGGIAAPEALRLLSAALRSFDEAAIFTIHGFCQRALRDNPFASGSLADTELLADQERLLQEVAADFWRDTVYRAPAPLVRKVVDEGVSPGRLLRSVGTRGGPLLRVIPELPLPELPAGDPDEAFLDQWLLALKRQFHAYLAAELPRRKRRANVRSFDDLLLDLYQALQAAQGDALAGAVRERYRAALVDEFQDTDPLQFGIFDALYPLAGEAPLFMIGDPKQAIYSFRGADVFAYLAAAAATEQRHTLDENWRSEPALVRAVNALFAGRPAPFLFPGIAFHPVRAAEREQRLLTVDGAADPAPFKIHFVPRREAGKPINKGDGAELLVQGVAAEIARLLDEGGAGRLLIGDRPLVAGDIAVLVRKNRQARLVQQELNRLGIPAVLRGAGNLFDSPEAAEILLVLGAVAEPADERRLRAALVTDLAGIGGDGLARLLGDESAWETVLEEFRGYHDLWAKSGCMPMAMRLLAGRQVRSRLLALPDGERRLTNILHCFELLHEAAVAGNLGMEATVSWLAERLSEEQRREEHEIRLETDEAAVQLVTIHKSKGLEYPVVFCPFCWEGRDGTGETVLFHDEAGRAVLDLGSPELPRHRQRAAEENLAEGLRLLYVAVTRAKNRCYLAWGAFKDAGGSAMHYLLHPDVPGDKGQVALSDEAIRAELEQLAVASGGAIAVTPLPPRAPAGVYRPPVAAEPLSCREFHGTIEHDWRVASFTSFVSQAEHVAELPDRDEWVAGDGAPLLREPPAERQTIRDFPRGTRAGIFLHEIFEELDFAAGPAGIAEAAVAEKLRRHGFAGEWLPAVTAMLGQVLTVPLPAGEASFRLADLRPGGWLTELEFYFPLRFITADGLREAAARWSGLEQPVSLTELVTGLTFQPVRGVVRGFVDLVCEWQGRYFIIDWKSNYLGSQPADYQPPQLRESMRSHRYPLQYLLYTVALHRHLAVRLADYDYDRHFGGVHYLFLRGIEAARGDGAGIFHDRPPRQLIEELERLFVRLDCRAGE
ncbi:hypothetical protein GURASL_01540 [Geotalea uraniireducens]|uniref:DNA 3'-5' helicase n=1 Tax=Geotalea uraniireducens TaxID=351604 RepID=A0ABM8EFR3_9BACT|nr:exodeoxyribonuclease V subunit beta [Geotalea uraniireducens]BDV41231.1 hypothetical protein GURASL_01540 [Geotalea uraniireducens]